MDLRKENGPFAKIVLTLLSLVVAATLQNSAVPANRSTFQLCTSWKCKQATEHGCSLCGLASG